jgi:RNA polymerase sigma-70 factor, ECF subfamily
VPSAPAPTAGRLSFDDDTVLAGARAGDEEAISRLYRTHQPRLLRVLRLEVGDAADDVASQTWLEVVSALRRFEGDLQGFRGLLYTIARRRVFDHRRTQRRRPAMPTEPASLVEAVDPAPSVEADALGAMDAEQAAAFIRRLLTPDQAEVVLLRVVAGMPVEQVARVLGRSPGSVRVLQHRALKRLAVALRSRNETVTRGDWRAR